MENVEDNLIEGITNAEYMSDANRAAGEELSSDVESISAKSSDAELAGSPKPANDDKEPSVEEPFNEEARPDGARGSTPLTSTTKIETFEEVTGQPAGEPLPSERYLRQDPYLKKSPTYRSAQSNPGSLYYPFVSETDFALASWFTKSKTSKGHVDDFMKDPRLHVMSENCSFRTAENWRQKMHNIPWGIKDDHWTAHNIHVDSNIVGVKSKEYTIYYRDVVETIRFLLGHGPFKDSLTYAPQRHYTLEGRRVYNEMHTGDWWWSQQEQLPVNATIVPLLLATDKTVLTQHHGDLSMWPVYLTIGNLNVKTRKSQIRPGMVLLGLIPVVKIGKEHGSDLKAQVYHSAMGRMLERKFLSSQSLKYSD